MASLGTSMAQNRAPPGGFLLPFLALSCPPGTCPELWEPGRTPRRPTLKPCASRNTPSPALSPSRGGGGQFPPPPGLNKSGCRTTPWVSWFLRGAATCRCFLQGGGGRARGSRTGRRGWSCGCLRAPRHLRARGGPWGTGEWGRCQLWGRDSGCVRGMGEGKGFGGSPGGSEEDLQGGVGG